MSSFDPYESHVPPAKATVATSGSEEPYSASAVHVDATSLPELPKTASSPTSRRGFPENLQAGVYPTSQPQRRPGREHQPSFHLGLQNADVSAYSSSGVDARYSSGISLEHVASDSKGNSYSVPPTPDPSSKLPYGEKQHDTWSPGLTPLNPARRPPSTPGSVHYRHTGSWWSRTFESPDWKLLAIHIGLCLIAFPAISLILPLARGTIFWVRVYVSLGCSAFGISIGFSLLNLARKWMEAAAWATAIHQSVSKEQEGIRVQDMALHTSDSASSVAALKLLWDRNVLKGTSRQSRRSYDSRPWSLFVAFFLFCLFAGASMAFVLGRVVSIDTSVLHQWDHYKEVAVAGDLSQADIAAAEAQGFAFSDFVRTWTLAPFASSEDQGRAVSMEFKGETVYFADATPSQLDENGHGLGTFKQNGTASIAKREFMSGFKGGSNDVPDNMGQMLRYPKWGIRIHCDSLPDASRNIVPISASGLTYVYLPKKTVSGLFSGFDMEMPSVFDSYNASAGLTAGDSFPRGSDPSSWAAGGRFWANGVAHSFFSVPISKGQNGKGWVQLETVLVRLNTSYVPKGNFPLYGEGSLPDAQGRQTRIGYDVAVCLELYEPWIVETYNSTAGLPKTMRVVAKGNVASDIAEEKRKGKEIVDVQRHLNSTGKWLGFAAAHDNSANQMVKDNGRDNFYVPSPTVVSFTDGSGPEGYTSLSASRFGQTRALADAANVLPFLTGTGKLVARAYDDTTQAYVTVGTAPLVVALGVALLLGVLAGVFTPRLPLGIPRREFGMYSWLAVLHGDTLLHELRTNDLESRMDVREVAKRVGNVRVRYKV